MIVRIRGVNRVRAKGRVYYYHRASGARLPNDPHSPEFVAALARLNSGNAPVPNVQPGTFGALVAAYRASPEFARLAPRTSADYQGVLNWLRGIDAMPIVQLDGPAMLAIRDKALAQKKRRFANHVLQVIGTLLNWGKPRRLSLGNPLAGIRGIKIPRPRDLPRANRPWSDDETAAVLGAATGGLRVALALACYAGMRGGDIVRVTWAAYDGAALTWRQGKTSGEVWLPCLPELKAILDAAPKTATTIATQQNGTPMTEAGLRKAFRTLILRLLRDGQVAPGLTLHGQRHRIGDALMEAGGSLEMVQAVLGQRSIAAPQHYSRGASRRRAASAAIELLANARGTILQNR